MTFWLRCNYRVVNKAGKKILWPRKCSWKITAVKHDEEPRFFLFSNFFLFFFFFPPLFFLSLLFILFISWIKSKFRIYACMSYIRRMLDPNIIIRLIKIYDNKFTHKIVWLKMQTNTNFEIKKKKVNVLHNISLINYIFDKL